MFAFKVYQNGEGFPIRTEGSYGLGFSKGTRIGCVSQYAISTLRKSPHLCNRFEFEEQTATNECTASTAVTWADVLPFSLLSLRDHAVTRSFWLNTCHQTSNLKSSRTRRGLETNVHIAQ